MMRVNPYTRLKEVCSKWADEVRYPHTRTMFKLTNVANGENKWQLYDVRERVLAGEQLGYHVQVTVSGNDLIFQYVKDTPSPPWEIRQ